MLAPVNVGKTDFPLRPTALDHTPVPGFRPQEVAPPFRLLDGPPYANGAPHLGHVLNKHLKDALSRAVQSLGHGVEWRPGWDCHGLPLELAVEKQGVPRADRSRFVSAAREFASSQASLQSSVFQQQGWCAQWGNPWHTQDPSMEAGTLRVLAQLLDRGVLDVRFAAVPWCPSCASTLSNAEQEEKETVVQAWLVPFELQSGQMLLSWTTTPWTLPLHRALVVNPEAEYVKLDLDGNSAWVSQDTSDRWARELGATVSSEVCLGASLSGQSYRSPWMQGQVHADASVLPGAGTGVLHAVPGLSELDTALARVHDWKVVQHLGVHGQVLLSPCLEQEGLVAGPKASAAVRGSYSDSKWFREMPYSTAHPHCWRHHVPLLTRASRQVFLLLTPEVRTRALVMAQEVEFSPESGRARLLASMRDRPDWCLSRQRTWGVPVALFLDRESGKPHAQASTFMRRVADEMEHQGVQAWWDNPSSNWLQSDVDPSDVDRVDDVLDVWFDSGCVPQLVGPADAVVEGTDQHRGWFQSCLWVAAALDTGLPFKRVATHGFVVDQTGEKLSKSKGGDAKSSQVKTTVAPWHTLPSDVVRVWALSGTDGHDKSWTQDTVQLTQGYLSRWRGVLRFLLANAMQQPQDPLLLQSLPAWDRYWWLQSQQVSHQVRTLVSQARFGEAVARAAAFGEVFSSHALGSWKDRLYCAPFHTQERQALDLAVRGSLEAWGSMMEVLAPRLRRDAQEFWPSLSAMHQEVQLQAHEKLEVEEVMAVRQAMATHAESLSKQTKGGAVTRRAFLWAAAPSWPGQLLADALDVGQVSSSEEGLHPLSLRTEDKTLSLGLGLSPDPLCPRCRRAQPAWQGLCCAVCQERACQENCGL